VDFAPEIVEPPDYAVGGLCRVLAEIAADHPEMWLHVFLDLLDKAKLADPSEPLAFSLRAALVSAPNEEIRDAAEAELRDFEAMLRNELKRGTRPQPEPRGDPEILIVVPKEVERRACAAVFECEGVEPRPFDTHVHYRRFPLALDGHPDGRMVITLVCLHEAGNLRTVNVVRDYVAAFGRPHLAVLCGMAMGTNPEKTKLGDIVIAQDVFDTGPRRVTPAGTQTRFRPYGVRSPLREALLEYADSGKPEILAELDHRRAAIEKAVGIPKPATKNGYCPAIRSGVILAGDTLVEDSEQAKELALHDQAYALEMEGAGFAATFSHLNSDWMVVRGLADFGEADRDKAWQGFATGAAASFVRSFLTKSWPATQGRH
jgi:nucleoside phosphorylase